jgi:Holliday junction DNA helicase RuvA
MAALVMLGFQKTASEKVVKAILKESPTITVEDAVRQALRRL